MSRVASRTGSYFLCALAAICAVAQPQEPYCGEEGVWIQTLGSGGAELNDRRGAASYLVWLDTRALLLVDPGPGSSLRFDEAGANFADLDAIVFTNLLAHRTADFPSFVTGSLNADRVRPLTVLGPDGDDAYPSTRELIERLIGPAERTHIWRDTCRSGALADTRSMPEACRRRGSADGRRLARRT